MSVIMLPTGEQLILQQIAQIEQELKQIRMDKNKAFHSCGDDKLANPHFHKLEQDERIVGERLKEIQNLHATAQLVQLEKRNIDNVAIGSIVKCLFVYPDFTEEEVYEIVGYGESNLDENKLYYDSPIAQKLLGLKVGEETSLTVSVGKVKCTVLHLYTTWDEVESH